MNWNFAYSLCYSMEHSPPWVANSLSSSQEIPCILWNSNFHYRNHKCPPSVPILSDLIPVHKPTPHFLKIQLNIILPSMHGSPKWSLSLKFCHQNPVYAFPIIHTRYMARPSHSSRFFHLDNIGWGEQILQLLIMLLPPLPCYLFPTMPKYSTQHPIRQHPQPVFLSECQQTSFKLIQNYSSVYLNL